MLGPSQTSADLRQHVNAGQKNGILFGRERRERIGLRTEGVSLADGIFTLPANPACARLNIVQAFSLMAFGFLKTKGTGAATLPFDGARF